MTYRVHARAKAGVDDVRLIRALVDEKRELERKLSLLTYDSIAEKFGLSAHTVRQIASRRTWTALK